jgi:molybdopterin biosynthesis enzyme
MIRRNFGITADIVWELAELISKARSQIKVLVMSGGIQDKL